MALQEITIGQTIYCVTDHCVVLPIIIESLQDVDENTQVTTTVVGESSFNREYLDNQHDMYFKRVYFKNGLPVLAFAFFSEKAAYDKAIELSEEKIDLLAQGLEQAKKKHQRLLDERPS